MAATRGNNAQFTYDFGIAIAQSTVNKLTRLTGATLTLASAFYALRSTADEYVNTLRKNTLRFGGVLSTMKAMEQAQERLIKGQSYFSVDDQLEGMNQLMSVGIDVGKNMEWINKAAHATGKSYAEFSGMIASAIQGNSQALVDAGLMTQRATRMFDRYGNNAIARQKAVLNFVKNHKGLMNAIKNDFETIQDQMTRLNGIWKGFLQSIIGKPNDPQSFYGQIVASMKSVAVALAQNYKDIQRYGYIIGQVLGWVIRQIGHFVVWVGRQVKKTLKSVWEVTDDFQNQARSLLVWLEFWKLALVDFFNEYKGEIKTLLKLLIAYQALKYVFVFGETAIASVRTFRKVLLGTWLLQKRYMASMGPYVGKFAKFFQSLAVWLPRPFRKAWVWLGKFFADFKVNMRIIGQSIIRAFTTPFKWLFGRFGKLIRLVTNLPKLFSLISTGLRVLMTALSATNPLGWVILAITFLVILYKKSETFRVFMNNLFKLIWESLKFIWNLLVAAVVYVIVGLKRLWKAFKTYVWEPIKKFFINAWDWCKTLWQKFMNTKIGKWLNDHLIGPIKKVFEWVVDAWKWVLKAIAKAVEFLSGANSSLAKNVRELADAEGLEGLGNLTVEGGNYDTNDSKDYLSFDNFLPGSDVTPPSNRNPLMPESGAGSSPTGNTTNVSYQSGAIQVNIVADGFDEALLAKKVKEIVHDLNRENAIRGGAT